MGQNIKSLAACVCVCVSGFGAKYLEKAEDRDSVRMDWIGLSSVLRPIQHS